METSRRILIADPNDTRRQEVADVIGGIITGAEFSFAKDGTEAAFKLNNAPHQIAFFSGDLPKRTGIQLTEWLLGDQRHRAIAVVLLSPIPDREAFVDEIVIGRVQFVPDSKDAVNFERAVARAFNFVSHGDKSEFHLRFLASEEALMKEGDKADNVYLVKKGRLRAQRKVDGKDVVLGHVEVGEFVGEMAYINGEPRSADVMAEVACELIEIPVDHLDHVLFQRPAWSKALMRTLSQRLKNANKSISRQ